MAAYSQNDGAWAGIRLGTGPASITIGKAGCFITAFSNVCKRAGKTITPAQMNQEMINRGFYVSGNLVGNHKVPAILYPDVLEFLGEVHWTGPTDMNYFNDANDPHIVYIVFIDASPAAGIQSHFTAVAGKDGNDLIIDDSWDGRRKKLSAYGHPPTILQAAYKFKIKTVAPPVVNQPVGDQDMARPTREEVIESYQKIAGRTPNEGEIDFHTKNSTFKSLIQGFFRNNDTAVNQIPGLKAKIDELDDRPTREVFDAAVATAKAAKEAELDIYRQDSEKQIAELKKELEAEKGGNIFSKLKDIPFVGAMFNKKLPGGKAVRTILQTFASVAGFVFGAPIAFPELNSFLDDPNAILTLQTIIPLGAGLWAYLQNKYEQLRAKKKVEQTPPVSISTSTS